jgi:hypothetical protein
MKLEVSRRRRSHPQLGNQRRLLEYGVRGYCTLCYFGTRRFIYLGRKQALGSISDKAFLAGLDAYFVSYEALKKPAMPQG